MSKLDGLPLELLRQIITLVTAPLRLDDTADSLDNVRAWCRLASVCKSWRDVMSELPVNMTLLWDSAAVNQEAVSAGWTPHPVCVELTDRITRLATCPAPICALRIRPLPRADLCSGFGTTDVLGFEPCEALADLLSNDTFSRRSGRHLHTVSMHQEAGSGFQCSVPLDGYEALTHISGISDQLPRLPAGLETLHWGDSGWDDSAAAEFASLQASLQLLPRLRHLRVMYLIGHRRPELVLGLLRSLPPTLQSLRCECDAGFERPRLSRQLVEASIPAHMQVAYWGDGSSRPPLHNARVSFLLI